MYFNGNTTIDNDANLGRTPKKKMMLKRTYKKIPKMAMTMTITKKKRPTTKPKMKNQDVIKTMGTPGTFQTEKKAPMEKIKTMGTHGTFQTTGDKGKKASMEKIKTMITGGKTIDINKVIKDRRKK